MNQTYLVYFSATGNSQTAVRAVASGLATDAAEEDVTCHPGKPTLFDADDLVVFAAPVYGGRIAPQAVERFASYRGQQTPAILAATYGNRAYDDALLELFDLAVTQGFVPFAAAAFVGEHSSALQMAANRPDANDIEIMNGFGKQCKQKLHDPARMAEPLAVPGNRPYRAGSAQVPCAPQADENCDRCGYCATVCPVGAIDIRDVRTSDVEKCIRCCACIKKCPKDARAIVSEVFAAKNKALEDRCAHIRKEPALFL